MNTEEATVVVTDEAGLEEPRIIEGTWDDTGHILTAIILPHDFEQSYPALYDETTYVVSFEDLESSYGTPVDPEDTEYPEAELTFTTGVRIGVLNHACIHVGGGPFVEVDGMVDPFSGFTDISTPHTHYTINLPPGDNGEPNVGYTYFGPNTTNPYVFFLRDPGSLQVELAILDWDTGEPGPFTALEVEEAPPACQTIRPRLTDPDTGEYYLGSPIVGITHEVRADMDENEFYMFKWTSSEDVTYTIVENASLY